MSYENSDVTFGPPGMKHSVSLSFTYGFSQRGQQVRALKSGGYLMRVLEKAGEIHSNKNTTSGLHQLPHFILMGVSRQTLRFDAKLGLNGS